MAHGRAFACPFARLLCIRPRAPAPLLVCFSHLRWDFVWQRPQHLLSRAAKHYRVLHHRRAALREGRDAAHGCVEASRRHRHRDADLAERSERVRRDRVAASLIDRLLAREPESRASFGTTRRWRWRSRAISNAICASTTTWTSSLFRGASQEMIDNEAELFRRADVVFTGMSLYEAKRNRHRNVHGFPSSIDFDHFASARRAADPEPSDQAAIPHPAARLLRRHRRAHGHRSRRRRRRSAARLAPRR